MRIQRTIYGEDASVVSVTTLDTATEWCADALVDLLILRPVAKVTITTKLGQRYEYEQED